MNDSKTAPSCAPQWEPPARMSDPLVRRFLIERVVWMRALRGRIPKIHDRAVAMALATYGNKDGTSNYPGVTRLADELFLSESTVKRSLSWLTEHGWLTVSERGDRWAGKSDVYRLALPAPVAAELGHWDNDANGAQWMERPASEPSARASEAARHRPVRAARGCGVGREIGVRKRDRCPEEEIGVCKDGDRGPSLDTPPEPVHQSLSNHHSALPARPAADAAQRDDEDAEEDAEEDSDEQARRIVRAVEAKTGPASPVRLGPHEPSRPAARRARAWERLAGRGRVQLLRRRVLLVGVAGPSPHLPVGALAVPG